MSVQTSQKTPVSQLQISVRYVLRQGIAVYFSTQRKYLGEICGRNTDILCSIKEQKKSKLSYKPLKTILEKKHADD